MATKQPGMFLVATPILAVSVAVGYGAYRAFAVDSPGLRFLGWVLALVSFLTFLLALACVVFAFGVDFR